MYCLHYRICFCWEPLLSRISYRRLVSIFPFDVTFCGSHACSYSWLERGLVNTLLVAKSEKQNTRQPDHELHDWFKTQRRCSDWLKYFAKDFIITAFSTRL